MLFLFFLLFDLLSLFSPRKKTKQVSGLLSKTLLEGIHVRAALTRPGVALAAASECSGPCQFTPTATAAQVLAQTQARLGREGIVMRWSREKSGPDAVG